MPLLEEIARILNRPMPAAPPSGTGPPPSGEGPENYGQPPMWARERYDPAPKFKFPDFRSWAGADWERAQGNPTLMEALMQAYDRASQQAYANWQAEQEQIARRKDEMSLDSIRNQTRQPGPLGQR